MSKRDKLLAELLSEPKDFRWDSLVILLKSFGYIEQVAGKTGGSRRKFFHAERGTMYFHRPHPSGILKGYQVKLVINTLKSEGLI